MSRHFRMDSDIDRTNDLKDAFPIFLEDFLLDFAFADIRNSYRILDVFTEEEISQLMKETDDRRQTIRMFFILLEKDRDLVKFLNLLDADYPWLKERVLKEQYSLATKQQANSYVNAVRDLRSNFPKHGDFNVHRFNHYFDIRESLRRLKPHHNLVICGELGHGKKWLAVDVCCDYSVMEKMSFKIFWLDVHNCDSQERDLETLQRLKLLLGETNFSKKTGDYEGISNKILELQQELRTLLKQDEFKDCLLVLADVQNSKTLEAFDLRCKILITTRNKKIPTYLSKTLTETFYISDGMTQSEGLELFEKVLNEKRSKFPKNSNDIFDQSKGHPFLLNIIAQHLKQEPHKEWDEWIRNLCDTQITNNKVNAIIQLSLNVLKPEELVLFHTLAIFYHSVKIPINILAAIWKKSTHETKEIVKKFDKYSLVNIVNLDESMACVLHFLYHSYLKNVDGIDRQDLNRRLVESYRIERVLENRSDVALDQSLNDHYFYHFIGYHLREARMVELFSKLYLDLGFIGGKLRATGLPNTIGDLKYFCKEITGGDQYKEKLVDSLLEFLPNIEEMIFRSADTCLLQYALMTDSLLKSEAIRQAKKFPDKIWFADLGHFHHRRQMISLPEKPKVIKLIEPDTCLIGLDNHNLLLADISVGYNIEPTIFQGHSNDIIEIQVFSRHHIISLDRKGEVCIWSIADERRRSVNRKQSSRLIVNHIDFATCTKMRRKECKQSIRKDIDGQKMPVQHFLLEERSDNSIYLHLAFTNGDITLYSWNAHREKFEAEPTPPLHTKMINIRFILKLFDKYYLVLNNTGSIKFFSLRDSSDVGFGFLWPKNTAAPIKVHQFAVNPRLIVIIFVFAMKVMRLTLPQQKWDFINAELETLFEITDRRTAITCSTISDDNRYLVLGTKQGIMVYDTIEKSEVLRSNISAAIVCVDMISVVDNIIVIASGSEGQKVLNLFGLKTNGSDSITWAHSVGTLSNKNDLSPQFEPNVWLMGAELFDMYFENDVVSLFAVDSKNRIHQLTTTNKKDWSISLPLDPSSNLSAITAYKADCYYGCENGRICNLSDDSFDLKLSTAITFLKLINENTLIVSAVNSDECVLVRDDQIYKIAIGVVACYIVAKRYLILLNCKCGFLILDMENNFAIFETCSDISKSESDMSILGGSDLKSDYFVIGTLTSRIFIYKFAMDKDNERKLRTERYAFRDRDESTPITCVAISSDAGLCAIGLNSGLVELYRIEQKTPKLLHKFESHKSQIYDLKFSPWIDIPTVLVSCSEQLCFWDVAYALNNPTLDPANGFRRHSSRFNISSLSSPTNGDGSSHTNGNGSLSSPSPIARNPWLNKTGPSDKRDLLACIKFVGNKATKFYASDDFLQFNTIDDEGVYYHMNVHDICKDNTNGTDVGVFEDEVYI